MGRLFAGIAAGFAVWFVVFVGTDSILKRFWTNYSGSSQSFFTSNTHSFIRLLLIVGCSIAAGYITALVSRESRKSTWFLGAVLISAAVFFGLTNFSGTVLWFNVAFLVAIMPFTILGGYLKN